MIGVATRAVAAEILLPETFERGGGGGIEWAFELATKEFDDVAVADPMVIVAEALPCSAVDTNTTFCPPSGRMSCPPTSFANEVPASAGFGR